MDRKRVLVICARNKIRSLTAEKLYRNDSRVEIRSAGLSKVSRRRVSARDIEWAELILVMEHAHKRRLKEQFRPIRCPIEVLGIEDIYQPMEDSLIEILTGRIEPLL